MEQLLVDLPFGVGWSSDLMLMGVGGSRASDVPLVRGNSGLFTRQPIQIVAGAPAVAATHAQLQSFGSSWPDGTMGVLPLGGGSFRFYAANGSAINSITGTLAAPIGSGGVSHSLQSPKDTYSYAAGGPVLKDTATGKIFMFVHLEKWPGGDGVHFWSELGLAVSSDGGATFTDLGAIISPNTPFTGTKTWPNQVDVGGGCFVFVGTYVYVYFMEFAGVAGAAVGLAVARCQLVDILAAAGTGAAPPFTKWDGSGWAQPGLLGLAGPLEAGTPAYGFGWVDVAYHSVLGAYFLVLSPDLQHFAVIQSNDGLHWSVRQPLANLADGELTYPTLVCPTTDGTRQVHHPVSMYYTYSVVGGFNRWTDAQLSVVPLTFLTGGRFLGRATTAPSNFKVR